MRSMRTSLAAMLMGCFIMLVGAMMGDAAWAVVGAAFYVTAYFGGDR